MQIAPSLLAADPLDLRSELDRLKAADYLHVDIFDDSFVKGATWGEHTLRALVKESPIPVEVHLMANDVDRWASMAAKAACWRIIVHYEALLNQADDRRFVRELGQRYGLAVSPHTPLSEVRDVVAGYEILLLMTVNPGRGGSRILANSVARAMEARSLLDEVSPGTILGVDGGVEADVVPALKQAGVQNFVVGSYLFAIGDPATRIAELQSLGKA